MKKKIKYISAICGLLGFVLIMGTVGASDLNLIDLETLTIRGGIGMVLMTVSVIGLKIGGCECVKG